MTKGIVVLTQSMEELRVYYPQLTDVQLLDLLNTRMEAVLPQFKGILPPNCKFSLRVDDEDPTIVQLVYFRAEEQP